MIYNVFSSYVRVTWATTKTTEQNVAKLKKKIYDLHLVPKKSTPQVNNNDEVIRMLDYLGIIFKRVRSRSIS